MQTFPACFYPVLDPPTVTRESTDNVRVSPGRTVSFSFTVDANPPTANTIERTGLSPPIPASITTANNMVVINDPGLSDGGAYRLIATNSAGSDDFSFFVLVECKWIPQARE